MPIGVEHIVSAVIVLTSLLVFLPVMPIGVVHFEYRERSEMPAGSVTTCDAVRR